MLQSVAYFLSLADGTRFAWPPPSPLRQSPRNSRQSSTRNSPSALRRVVETTNFATGSEHGHVPIQEDTGSSYESDFALEDFNIKSVLGSGRTKVYYEAKHQLALKGIDLWKRPNMFAELHHKIEIYRLLSPKLVLHGY